MSDLLLLLGSFGGECTREAVVEAPTDAEYIFDFSAFFLPDGLFERLICAIITEETKADKHHRCVGKRTPI